MINKKEYFFKKYKCNNILHIGGHIGQEAPIYKELGLLFTFVEPIPKYINILKNKGYNVIEGAVTKKKGKLNFNIANVTERSSLKNTSSDIMTVSKCILVNTFRLKDIQDGFDGLVIDAQGETYDILKSGKLDFKVIICETSEIPRYEGEGSRDKVLKLLTEHGYKRINTFKHKTLDIYDDVFVM